MSSFSYSAQYFSKEAEQCELAELTEADKEAILKDMYGRTKRNNISNQTDEQGGDNDSVTNGDDDDDDDDDISENLIQEYHEQIEHIPFDKVAWFLQALSEADDVVEAENCPSQFLRNEDYDPRKAALRLCEYWKMRVEIFGEEHAFKPMSLDGAMLHVVPYMVQMPNLVRFLPDDDEGRTVVCFDRTDISFKECDDIMMVKIIWYVGHLALQRRSVQRKGIVIVQIDTSSSWNSLPPLRLVKLATKSLSAVPIKICCRHVCVSSLMVTLLLPIGKYFMPRHERLRLKVHDVVKIPSLLSELEQFGLHRHNLPKSVGGDYDNQTIWLDECKRIMERKRARRRLG